MKTKKKTYENESMIRAVKDKNLSKLKNILETSKCCLNYSDKVGKLISFYFSLKNSIYSRYFF